MKSCKFPGGFYMSGLFTLHTLLGVLRVDCDYYRPIILNCGFPLNEWEVKM